MTSVASIFEIVGATVIAATLAPSIPAHAQTVVQFEGIIVPSCILTVNTPGVLAMSTSGTEFGSEQPGGIPAVLAIVAIGGAPTVLFTAPIMSIKPVSYVGTPTLSLKYTSLGGANQPYVSTASQYTSANPLTDVVTLDAKAEDAAGFSAGTYRVQTTVTCQQ